jgi:hypothetical protein
MPEDDERSWDAIYTPRYSLMPPIRFVPASGPAASLEPVKPKASGEEIKAYYQQVISAGDALPEELEELSFCALCELKVKDEAAHSKSIGHLLAKDRNPVVIATYYKLRADSKGCVRAVCSD